MNNNVIMRVTHTGSSLGRVELLPYTFKVHRALKHLPFVPENPL